MDCPPEFPILATSAVRARSVAMRKLPVRPASCEGITPWFQPVVDLRRGRVAGFEALARHVADVVVRPPAAFLDAIPQADRLGLFEAMLDQSLATMTRLGERNGPLTVSVNVERYLVVQDAFFDALTRILGAHGYPGSGLILEILEHERIEDEATMIASLSRIRGLGVQVALDDIGTAHSSLLNIKTLPITTLKLDQSFARGLPETPHDLQFVLSILSLARGLGKTLVVEGVETPDILDALMILGVEFAQGYAIARPMPAERLPGWLAGYMPPVATRAPRSLLGAFASHLTVMETCRMLISQPLPISWHEGSQDPHACEIGRYFDRCGCHDSAFGQAHKHFHRVMACYGTDYPAWKSGADAFGTALAAEIVRTRVP